MGKDMPLMDALEELMKKILEAITVVVKVKLTLNWELSTICKR